MTDADANAEIGFRDGSLNGVFPVDSDVVAFIREGERSISYSVTRTGTYEIGVLSFDSSRDPVERMGPADYYRVDADVETADWVREFVDTQHDAPGQGIDRLHDPDDSE